MHNLGLNHAGRKRYTYEMKQCKYCGKSYPETDYGVAKTTAYKIYRRLKCRFCYRKTKNALKALRRTWIDEYKAKKACMKCGIRDYRVLEFHHRDETEKQFGISDFYYHQFSMEKVKEEMAKCEVVCANCHRLIHYERRKNRL